MGKTILKRATGQTRPRAVVSASFPVLGGACFVVGSCFFWPTVYSINWAGNLAASMFTVGSSFYVVAPVLDYMDMYYGIDLVRPPSSTAKGTEQLEWLYVMQVLLTRTFLKCAC